MSFCCAVVLKSDAIGVDAPCRNNVWCGVVRFHMWLIGLIQTTILSYIDRMESGCKLVQVIATISHPNKMKTQCGIL